MDRNHAVQLIRESTKELMKSVRTVVDYNGTTAIVYVNLTKDGELIIVPENPTQAIQKMTIPDVGILFGMQ